MADFNTFFPNAPTPQSAPGLTAKLAKPTISELPKLGTFDDAELLRLWEDIRKECIDQRLIFERQWHRNLLYTLGRQWIEWHSIGGWKDKRMAQWMPRPVTNKCKETVQAIRAMFASIRLSVNARPNGNEPTSVSAASTADELGPVLHETHNMNTVQNEFDFWLLVTGNAFFHTYVSYDLKNGTIKDPSEQCTQCGQQSKTSEIYQANNSCPGCGGTAFMPAMDEQGQLILNEQPKGRPTTTALSPLELAFPHSSVRFEDVPYVVRLRWRPKRYYEDHPILKNLVPEMVFQKSPTDLSLNLYRAMSQFNDMGVAASYYSGSGGSSGWPNEEGIAEYEVWYKPCDAYPEGLVFRVAGDRGTGRIIHLEDTEALPGPLPYKDADGNPLFTFAHAGYEHVGGRTLASGPLDVIIQKQDQLNQLDSSVLLAVNRMANPVWMIPKGAEPTKVTGMPGLVIEWNAMAFGGTAKPERLEGVGPHPSLAALREQYLRDIEELAGTFDIIKGQKPAGVEAFSALQLLVERSQSRFASVFTARGEAYKNWFKFAIELEREFGPDDITKATLSPARRWTFQNFKRAQLQGSISVVVEDGSNVPKTSLGMRAALDHANQLGMVNMQDPDQQYEGLKLMGLTKMVPTLDLQVQSALQKQQAFEDWANDQMAVQQSIQQSVVEGQQYQQQLQQHQQQIQQITPGVAPLALPALPPPPSILAHTPLKWKPWYQATIHRNEFLKWANGDTVRELLQQKPALEQFLVQHLTELEQAMAQQAQLMMMIAAGSAPPPMQGAGRAMVNSNQNANSPSIVPSGAGQGAQRQGPA